MQWRVRPIGLSVPRFMKTHREMDYSCTVFVDYKTNGNLRELTDKLNIINYGI